MRDLLRKRGFRGPVCYLLPMARRTNRLGEETSPYLLQHAHNPVEWHPWGPEALDRARREDRPILLSIGYAACHWCHVMERECFENDAIARQMNENFVCIKIDREERPDLDEIYMAATVALSGSGGWPMTVFLTPDRRPFFAGTYFPPQPMHGRPGFPDLLDKIGELWKSDRKTLLEHADQLTEHVQAGARLAPPGGVSEDALRAACRALARDFDASFGGFGRAPKFPQPAALSLLLRQHRRTRQDDLLHMVTRTLDGMMSGGMYDQLGGGFARYSVDERWLVPHFEKMLYDNAQLVDAYIEGYQVTGNPEYRRIVRETLDYLLREMRSPEGGFFSSSDADTEGEEGKFFVWSKEEIVRALGQPSADYFCAFFGVTEDGNFEGKNVLSTFRSLSSVAKDFGLEEGQLVESLESSRQKLLDVRRTRVAPAVDDKIIAGWNGLAIRALANGARLLGDHRYLTAAEDAADYLLTALRRADGGLFRTARNGRAHTPGFLEDYAYLVDALLSVYEAGGPAGTLHSALQLARRMLQEFEDPEAGALYHTAVDASSDLISRPREGHDGALPNPNAVAARCLSRLAGHMGQAEWQDRAQAIVRDYARPIQRVPRAFCTMLSVVDSMLQPNLEVVYTGNTADEIYRELTQTVAARFLPHRLEAHLASWADGADLTSPLVKGKGAKEGAPMAYVCEDFVCRAPSTSPEDLARAIDALEKQHRAKRATELGRTVCSGRATASGTAELARQSKLGENALSRMGDLTISRFGIGTHRVGLDEPAHREALEEALGGGINLIDTSPTFAWGDSQRLVGEVLRKLSDEGIVTREQVVIVSKVGVAIGAEAEELARRLGGPDRDDTVPLGEEADLSRGAFCLEATFLQEQLARSLDRLGADHIDCCLIQSPEHLLLRGKSQEQYRKAMSNAFRTMENLVRSGHVGRYGVFSNTAALESSAPGHVDIFELQELAAEAVGSTHHFATLELPINVVERAALAGEPSLARRAEQSGIAVLGVRPLSVVTERAVIRLVEPPREGAAGPLGTLRYRVASLEAEFETSLAPQLRLAGLASQTPILPLSGQLGKMVEEVESLQQFQLAETTMVTPRLRAILAHLDQALSGPEQGAWIAFRNKYVEAVGNWLAGVRARAAEKNAEFIDSLRRELPTSAEFRPMAQTTSLDGSFESHALSLIANAPGVTACFVGMRTPNHAKRALEVLKSLVPAAAP